jgi:uncharacterized membrane protein YgcG
VLLSPLYGGATLGAVGNEDWLERGHGGGESLQPLIKSAPERGADRVSVRGVLGGASTAAKRPPRRRTKALVGWLLYCATAVGGTAAAFTVRDTLFPSLGAPTKAATWLNRAAAPHNTAPTETTPPPGSDAVAGAILVETNPSVIPPSVEDQTVPSTSDQGTSSSTQGRAPTARSGPGTGTTVDDNPSRGPGPGTTVDEDDPAATSPTGTTPHEDDPVTTVSTTPDPSAPATTDPDHKGKGGGGGDSGGGGGSGGGGHSGD